MKIYSSGLESQVPLVPEIFANFLSEFRYENTLFSHQVENNSGSGSPFLYQEMVFLGVGKRRRGVSIELFGGRDGQDH